MAFFELAGGVGCEICAPWVGVLVTDDEGEAEMYGLDTVEAVEDAGVFHDGCEHEWQESSPEEPQGAQEEAQEWASDEATTSALANYFEDFVPNATQEEAAAFRAYSGDGYENINQYLRGTYGYASDLTKGYIDTIDAAMQPLTEPVIVWRGPGSSTGSFWRSLGTDGYEIEAGSRSIIGKELRDLGYLSTSPNRTTAFQANIMLKIRVEKGTKAAWLGVQTSGLELSENKGEQELLLQRGMRLKITGIHEETRPGYFHKNMVVDVVASPA